jgi:succinyl-CoA synthetase beta subunit
MRLVEHEGKELLRAAGVPTAAYETVRPGHGRISLAYPLFLKSQVPASDRMRKGGIIEIADESGLAAAVQQLFATPIDGHAPQYLLAEEKVSATQELYVSFSYTGEARGPVLAVGREGGSGVHVATIIRVPILSGLTQEDAARALVLAGIESADALTDLLTTLWDLFVAQKLMLLEINPLFVREDGSLVAGDAKVMTDPAVTNDAVRPYVALGGDIAVIASGGGASMLTIDLLMRAGGKPANYVEYSGNPPASVVEELTVRVLHTAGLRGAWIVGGTAYFPDTYETMRGFLDGLRRITPKPAYPIVVRRDGPRQQEAKALLEQVARDEGYDITVFGPECSMAASAEELLSRMQSTQP